MGIQEEEMEKVQFKEIIVENVPNLEKELDLQVHDANRTPYYLNAKRLLQDTSY